MVLHWVENVRYFAVIWTSRTISKKQFRMGIGAIATKKYAARTFDLSDVCFIEGKSTQVKKIHSESQTLDGGAGSSAAGGKITLVGSNKIITFQKHARTVTMTAVGPSPSNFIFIGVMFWWVHLSYQSLSDKFTILQSTLGRSSVDVGLPV